MIIRINENKRDGLNEWLCRSGSLPSIATSGLLTANPIPKTSSDVSSNNSVQSDLIKIESIRQMISFI